MSIDTVLSDGGNEISVCDVVCKHMYTHIAITVLVETAVKSCQGNEPK